MKQRNFRKRSIVDDGEEDEQERRLALEEVKFLQKQRERKLGVPAISSTASQVTPGVGGASNSNAGGLVRKVNDKADGDAEKDELVLQDTFAQETAVMEEDPNMLRYVEQELAKKRGKNVDVADQAENEVKRAEDELYKIPEHLKVKRRNSEESSTQWTTGIAEIQLPIEYKLKNIEETEAAKKLLQEKRLMGRARTESSIPSSYSADYFQRGKDYAEKLRRGADISSSFVTMHPLDAFVIIKHLHHQKNRPINPLKSI
ncbi:protein COP1 SUPPRESSOR 2 isoform X2 [Lycium barbarum]|uniref:protein COP1 SUPPRESSOR 2 isoform X2 n=1 Tax=Lycium barbarum TaxID=112863 RepID=UPI00293F4496|nr:protein COP1 SUPPRESSOR 2 isoform X2 [Lycium barbarum]